MIPFLGQGAIFQKKTGWLDVSQSLKKKIKNPGSSKTTCSLDINENIVQSGTARELTINPIYA